MASKEIREGPVKKGGREPAQEYTPAVQTTSGTALQEG